MRKTPLLPVALALMAGILVARWWLPLPDTWVWLLAGGALLTGGVLLVGRKVHTAVLPAVVVLSGAAGGLLMALQLQHDWSRTCPEKAYMAVRLTETPVPREKSWRAKGRVESVGVRGQASAATGDITLYLRKDSTAASLRYGDRLLLHGYPDRQRRSAYVTSDHYILVGRDSTSLRARCEQLRMSLLRRMQSGPLDRRRAGVAEALALGWRGDVESETQASFRDAGIAHLLAVSGLHVGLLAGIVGAALIWLGKERRGRTIRGAVQLTAVWVFALLTGLAPSTVRAALMFSLFIVARMAGRRTPGLNLLAATAIVTLGLQPQLLFDLGWQLSYSAVAGILLARPVITAFRHRLWQLVAVSTFATLATLPVVATTFHRFPTYFLVANVVVVPLAGVMLGLSLAYMAVPCGVTAWPLDLLIRLAEWVTAQVASWPGAVVEI